MAEDDAHQSAAVLMSCVPDSGTGQRNRGISSCHVRFNRQSPALLASLDGSKRDADLACCSRFNATATSIRLNKVSRNSDTEKLKQSRSSVVDGDHLSCLPAHLDVAEIQRHGCRWKLRLGPEYLLR